MLDTVPTAQFPALATMQVIAKSHIQEDLKARIRRRRRGRRCALGGGAEVLQQPVVNTMVEQIITCYDVGSSVGCSVGSSRRTCCLGRTPHWSKQVSPEGLHPVEDLCLCKREV